jgi:ATP synthase protein I
LSGVFETLGLARPAAAAANRAELMDRAQHIAWKLVAWQLVVGLVVALPWCYAGWRAALGAGAGALSAALGSAVAAWRHFGRPGESAQQLARRFIAATALRWVTMLVVLYLAVARLALPPGAVLSGLVAGLAVYLFALRWE